MGPWRWNIVTKYYLYIYSFQCHEETSHGSPHRICLVTKEKLRKIKKRNNKNDFVMFDFVIKKKLKYNKINWKLIYF